jgi:hypothetical protein
MPPTEPRRTDADQYQCAATATGAAVEGGGFATKVIAALRCLEGRLWGMSGRSSIAGKAPSAGFQGAAISTHDR